MESKNQIRTRTRVVRAGVAAVSFAVVALSLWAPAAFAKPRFYAVSSERACLANRNVNPFLRSNHANVLRLIVAPADAFAGSGVACVTAAHAAGFKVYLSIQFQNRLTPQQAAVLDYWVATL